MWVAKWSQKRARPGAQPSLLTAASLAAVCFLQLSMPRKRPAHSLHSLPLCFPRGAVEAAATTSSAGPSSPASAFPGHRSRQNACAMLKTNAGILSATGNRMERARNGQGLSVACRVHLSRGWSASGTSWAALRAHMCLAAPAAVPLEAFLENRGQRVVAFWIWQWLFSPHG